MTLEQIDTDLFFADFGVSVTAGAISGMGIIDQNSELILQGQVVVVDFALTCRTDQFGLLGYGDSIVVDGGNYKVVHEPLRFADGIYCVVPLEVIAPNEVPTPQRPVTETRIDTSTTGVIYVGQAINGAAESSPVWTITRSTYSPAGIRTGKGTATGVTWTGRAGHTYI